MRDSGARPAATKSTRPTPLQRAQLKRANPARDRLEKQTKEALCFLDPRLGEDWWHVAQRVNYVGCEHVSRGIANVQVHPVY